MLLPSFERQEEVERVLRCDADAGRPGRGRGRPRVDRRVVGRSGRVDAVEAEVEAQHADGVRDRVAATEVVVEREGLAVRMAQHGRVLRAMAVVEGDPAEGVGQRCARFAARSGRVDRGAREGPRLAVEWLGQDDLAEAVVVEVLGDHERLRQRDEHALVALGVVGVAKGSVDVGSAASCPSQQTMLAVTARDVAVRAIERRLVEALAGVAASRARRRRRSTSVRVAR